MNEGFKDRQVGVKGLIKRLFIMLVFFVPFLMAMFLEFDFMGTSRIRIVLDCVFRMAVPCFFCGFALFSLAPYFYNKFDAIDSEKNHRFLKQTDIELAD